MEWMTTEQCKTMVETAISLARNDTLSIMMGFILILGGVSIIWFGRKLIRNHERIISISLVIGLVAMTIISFYVKSVMQ